MKVRIKFRHWLLRLPFTNHIRGIVLYPWVLFRDKPEAVTHTLARHEFEHVRQVRREGWLRFYLTYLFYQIKYGYRENPFEVEARLSDTEPMTADEMNAFAHARLAFWNREDTRND